MRFRTKSIQSRFLLLFCAIGILVAAVVTVGHLTMSGAIDEFRRVVAEEIAHERIVNGAVIDFKKQVQEWKNILLRGSDDKQRDKYWGKFQDRERDVQAGAESLLSMMPASDARELVQGFLDAHRQMGQAYRTGFDAFVAAGFDPATGDAAVKGIDREPTRLLEEAAVKIAEGAASVTATALSRAATASLAGLLATITVLVVGVLISSLFVRSQVLKPMNEVVGVLDRLAEGDFKVDIDMRRDDELGRLAASARRIRDDLGALLCHVVEMARELDHASVNLAALSEQNRVALDGQRDGTSQVATATEELAATAKDVAGSATGAAVAADRASTSTTGGMEVVRQAIDSINHLESDVGKVSEVLNDLEAHSGAIGNVLNVIRGIAEQTNLLALNAAIEAARAGDQGRGFAVVADEVRSLAQRTQESTQEIQQTIEQLQDGARAAVAAMEHGRVRVDDGVTRTQQVADALAEISAAVATIVDMTGQIATAAEQQGTVASDVSRNVNAIDQSSLDLAAAGESVAQTSRQIAKLSADLVKAASRFHV